MVYNRGRRNPPCRTSCRVALRHGCRPGRGNSARDLKLQCAGYSTSSLLSPTTRSPWWRLGSMRAVGCQTAPRKRGTKVEPLRLAVSARLEAEWPSRVRGFDPHLHRNHNGRWATTGKVALVSKTSLASNPMPVQIWHLPPNGGGVTVGSYTGLLTQEGVERSSARSIRVASSIRS